MRTLKFGIVGFGAIARTHALAAADASLRQDLPFNLELAAVVTRSPEKVKLQGVQTFETLKEAIETCQLDFISICTPNHLHQESVEIAAAMKVPVYCEKPLASDDSDAALMCSLVEQSSVQNGAALMYRFMPALTLLKKCIDKNRIGRLISFEAVTYHSSYLSASKKGVWRTKAASGGGALLDLGVHLMDMLLWSLGPLEVESASSRVHFRERTDVDEISKVYLKSEEGFAGTLEVSRVYAEHLQRDGIEIFGEKGSLKMSSSEPYRVEYHSFETGETVFLTAEGDSDAMRYYPARRAALGFFQSCHTASLVEFAHCVFAPQADRKGADFKQAFEAQKRISEAYRISKREVKE